MNIEEAKEPFKKRATERMRKIRFNMCFQVIVVLLCSILFYLRPDILGLAIVVINCLPFIFYIRDYKYYKGFLND